MRLSFELGIERCATPVAFEMDLAVSINARDAKPPGRLMSLIESATSGARTLTKTTAVFAVKLVPPMTKKAEDLWRLDTAKKYVRGQEALKGWKARGVSLVKDYEGVRRREGRRVEVEGVRAMLKAHPPLALTLPKDGSGGDYDEEEERKRESGRESGRDVAERSQGCKDAGCDC